MNFIKNQADTDKIYLYAKDPFEAKYQFLINKRGSTRLKCRIDPKTFIEYSNDMQDVYENIEDYNTAKNHKRLIVFDDMIADMINNKKLNSVVTELFITRRKLNISIACITQSYFKVAKDVRRSSTHFFIIKISNKGKLQQIALNHLPDIDFKDFMKIYKKYTSKSYFFLVIDTVPAKFTYSLLVKTFAKQLKTIEDQVRNKLKL